MKTAVPLLQWQKGYIEDRSRFTFLVASVQSGKSFAGSLKHVLRRVKKPGLSILLSASDRQSLELMQKIQMHLKAMGAAFESETGFFEQTSIAQHSVALPNGSRIIGLPANPDTARGYSGDVMLDEFAMHRDARAIWAALFGRITRGYDMDVFSTFKGTDNKFYEMARELGLHEGMRPPVQPVRVEGSMWSGHWVDIYMAREQGLKVDIEGLRAALGDDEVFLQEYCNVPMSSAEEFIPIALVLGCESSEASTTFETVTRGDLYAGMDIGRKRDLSVIWIFERVGETLITRGVITMDRQPFAEQLQTARGLAGLMTRFCVDATGIGAMLAEELQREFPGIVEPVQFTPQTKERMAVEIKRAIEERTVLIPESRSIRRAIQSVKRYIGSTGQMRFDAAHTERGHADEFWALALANAAASEKAYIPASEGGMVGDTVLGNLVEAVF